MKKTIKLLTILLASGSINHAYAQWSLTGNSDATPTSFVGTTNAVQLNLATKNLTRLVLDTNGRIGIGIAAPTQLFTVQSSGGVPAGSWISSGKPVFAGYGESTPGNADFNLLMASATNNARGVFGMKRSRGTLSAPTVVQNNDQLGSLLVSGFDGSAFQGSAAVDFFADGTPTAGNLPARISFVTCNNSSTRTERLKIGSGGDATINSNQFFVQKSSGNVGFGTISPGAKLDVLGSVKITDGTQGFGKYLMSDSNGLASWRTFGPNPWNFAGSNILNNNSGNVGIGTTTPLAKLHVVGDIKIEDGTQGAGKVLTSDANGLASWQSAGALVETDPKVGNVTFGAIPKWNGTLLTDGLMYDIGLNMGIGVTSPNASALLHLNSTNKGVLFPQVSIDSLKDVTSVANPANGLIVYNITQPGATNDMQRGYYYYSTNALSWVRLSDNFNDNKWQAGGLLGIQLKDKSNGVEIMDEYNGSAVNWQPKVKILKVVDSALLNSKNNITALVLTGVNKKTSPGWEFRQKTSIIFENNYLLPDGITSGRGDNVAISAYTENTLPNQTTQSQGLAFYVTAPPQNTGTADTPSLSMYRHNVGIGTYVTDVNNVTEGRLQVTGFSNGDQMSLRHPSSINLKWGFM